MKVENIDATPCACPWIHSGHGHFTGGVQIVESKGGSFVQALLSGQDLDGLIGAERPYNLVFMNTCESTDAYYDPKPKGRPYRGYDNNEPAAPLPADARRDVLKIGEALHARNYVGWDTSIKATVGVSVPRLFIEALDSTHCVADAVEYLKDPEKSPLALLCDQLGVRGMQRHLRVVMRDDSFKADLVK